MQIQIGKKLKQEIEKECKDINVRELAEEILNLEIGRFDSKKTEFKKDYEIIIEKYSRRINNEN